MLSLHSCKSIEDIVAWETKIPKYKVYLIYKRKEDRLEYFTCVSYLDQSERPRLHMSSEDLIQICQHITNCTNWIGSKFKLRNVLNP